MSIDSIRRGLVSFGVRMPVEALRSVLVWFGRRPPELHGEEART